MQSKYRSITDFIPILYWFDSLNTEIYRFNTDIYRFNTDIYLFITDIYRFNTGVYRFNRRIIQALEFEARLSARTPYFTVGVQIMRASEPLWAMRVIDEIASHGWNCEP